MKLVFLHGAGSSSLAFYYQLRHFRNSKAIDLPGHPDHQPCPSIDSYVEWVRGFNTARRYKDVVLCGHSMGGAIAMKYALRYPDQIKGLILIGTGAKLRVHPDYLNLGREPGENNGAWLEGQKRYFQAVEQDIYQVLVRRSEEIGPQVELNDLMACDQFDIMDQVGEIELPTQVICGGDDVMTPVKYAEYLGHQIKGARVEVVPKASHFVQLEKYHQVNNSIEQFMASLK